MTAAAHSREATRPSIAGDLQGILRRMKDAARAQGAPTQADRLAALGKLEQAISKRKDAIAEAIGRDFGNRSRHGGVSINETLMHFVQEDLPFGGVGASGMGHYHAREGFLTLSKAKAVFRQSRINTTGFLRPPYGKLADRLLRVLIGK